jgi:hypothetical protein
LLVLNKATALVVGAVAVAGDDKVPEKDEKLLTVLLLLALLAA